MMIFFLHNLDCIGLFISCLKKNYIATIPLMCGWGS